MVKWGLLILFVVLCNIVGAIGAMWTSADGEWYKNLEKPSINPPGWIFAPVWTLLFCLMGVALYFVWTASSSEIRTIALILFVAQFVLNVLWSFLFFGANNAFYSFIDIIFLEILILATGIYFFRVDKFAGYLLVPYFLWVGFASVLNFLIWKLN